MFEDLYYQDEARNLLESDFRSNRLPPTLLFNGPAGSGKLTAALELARIVSCRLEANHSCSCPACMRHRGLSHNDMLLLGSRTWPEEIQAAASLYFSPEGKDGPQGNVMGQSRLIQSDRKLIFLRATRKLLARFDPNLYAGEESRLGKAATQVREVEEFLSELEGGTEPSKKAVQTALSGCSKLEALIPDAPPVFMIRNVEIWARLAPSGNRKMVIIENADRMQEAARNALLKILEEPPETVRFVLVTPRRGAMLATILSRSRTYRFYGRTAENSLHILDRVFGISSPQGGSGSGLGKTGQGQAAANSAAGQKASPISMEDFFASCRNFTPDTAETLARSLLGVLVSSIASRRPLDPALQSLADTEAGVTPDRVMDSILEETADFGSRKEEYAQSFPAFLSALYGILRTVIANPECGASTLAIAGAWSELLRDAKLQYEAFNRSPALLLHSLYLSMEAAA